MKAPSLLLDFFAEHAQQVGQHIQDGKHYAIGYTDGSSQLAIKLMQPVEGDTSTLYRIEFHATEDRAGRLDFVESDTHARAYISYDTATHHINLLISNAKMDAIQEKILELINELFTIYRALKCNLTA